VKNKSTGLRDLSRLEILDTASAKVDKFKTED
jgi:hypothetical protein